MAGLAIRGEVLWDLFKKEGATFSEDLVQILKVYKHDNLFALNNWKGEEDKQKLVKFMRETLHEVVAPSDLGKYYGIFKDKPSKFILLDEKELDAMVSLAQKLCKSQLRTVKKSEEKSDKHSSVATDTAFNNGSQACGNNSGIATAEKILKEKNCLEEQLNKHFEKELPNLLKEDGSYGFSVLTTASGSSYESSVDCPFSRCGKMTKVTKNGNRWNPGNYYRHLRSHESANKKKNEEKGSKRKQENPLDKYISRRNGEEKSEGQETDEEQGPGERKKKRSRPLSDSESEGEGEGQSGERDFQGEGAV